MADKLRAEAANSLLKLLEEPPAYLKLLLLSESENILPTLRSRVQHFLVVESAQGIQPLLTKQELPWTDWKEWQAVLSDLDPARPIDRAQISAILYRMPLMHNQIQQELIRKAWKKS